VPPLSASQVQTLGGTYSVMLTAPDVLEVNESTQTKPKVGVRHNPVFTLEHWVDAYR
jgi:hypothetical protein